MSAESKSIGVKYGATIDVWPAAPIESVGICIKARRDQLLAYLTADQIDALIRALAAARVELSKARP